MPTCYSKDDSQSGFRDINGKTAYYKDNDSTRLYTIDWTAELDGDPVVTEAWTAEGVTIDETGGTGGIYTAVVTGSGGELKHTISTALNRVLVKRIRLIEMET